MVPADAFTPPLPAPIRIRPPTSPATPGSSASTMWPAITTTPDQNSVRSLPSTRSASQPPPTVARYTLPL